jgi:hypothetical protein
MSFLSAWSDKAARGGPVFNSLDAMKFFAVVNMTVDHIGAYFFPDLMWLRAIGRITFPVWFFLVGYSRGRGIGRDLWVYALLLVAAQPFVGQPIFPMNALVTVILCRYVLNVCTDRGWLPARIPELIMAFLFLSIFTMSLFDYGSVAFLFAMMGRMVREKERKNFTLLVVASYGLFILWQSYSFQFDMFQWTYVVLGTAWVVGWLARCPLTPIWENWQDSPAKRMVALLSRNTLSYYFYHRLIFQLLGALAIGGGIHFSFEIIEFSANK